MRQAALALLLLSTTAMARDAGQWDATDQYVRRWYQGLMQPDVPQISCCGEADAYWADGFEVSADGEYIAIITDERADAPLQRPHIEVGTRVTVPHNKLKFDEGNPTGHGVIFMRNTDSHVFCYVTPGGV